MRLPTVHIDTISFIIGFAAGSVFWWLLGRMRPLARQIRRDMAESNESAQARRTSNVEENHRRNTLRAAQGMHLAAPLFALDEILLAPRLIAPLPIIEPGDPPIIDDIVTQTLPYLPSWPELAAVYSPASIKIEEALLGGRNLVITGQPGLGKTVALAHLASKCAKRDEDLGKLVEKVPFLLHVADLKIPVKEKKYILDPIIDVLAENATLFDAPRLSEFIVYNFQSGRALFLLDGYDELAPEGQRIIVEFLSTLLEVYPKIQIVTTGCPEKLGGLVGLQFAQLALMAWGPPQHNLFLEKWADLWTKFVEVEAWSHDGAQPVDPLLLNSWLDIDDQAMTPFELTLLVWGAYAGDCLGPGILDAINTHLRRLAPKNVPIAALEMLGMQVVLTLEPIFDTRKAREWVRSFEPPEERTEELEAEIEEAGGEKQEGDTRKDKKRKKGKSKKAAPAPGLLPKMASSGLLVSHLNNRMRFSHPVIGAYLAGQALAGYNADDNLTSQPDWSGKLLAIKYLATTRDISDLVNGYLSRSALPLHTHLLVSSRWLRFAPKNAAWRGKIMTQLAKIMQAEGLPLGLRGQAMAAFALSNDPAVGTLFRQLMQTNLYELVQLAALGSGVIKDSKAIPELASIIRTHNLASRRAACLALVSIGTPDALEEVARSLLQGDEDTRRAAAEALASHPAEGHPMLTEGVGMEDVLVRRAAVYGLGRINEPWASELIEKSQVEDDEWIVRTAATDVLEARAQADLRAPKRLPPPSEQPWLIEFASTQGMGISPGSPATDVLLLALKSEHEETRLAALSYLRLTPSEGVLDSIYQAMYSDDLELREACFQVIAELGSGGMKLPDPQKIGLG
ncbi:MAG: HEAT repeat domain-containing protein [Anaerolineales bacterium]|nr:HEAT repeat domain-containing protein [Anaerolineales bacterium]